MSSMADDGQDVHTLIEHDKKYPIMVPKNGKYFTFRIIDTHNDELTKGMLNRGVHYAWRYWMLRTNIDVRQARVGDDPDFKILIRAPKDDERKIMTSGTIMYHFMPIARLNHPLRGLCVINPDFFYTIHGNVVPLHEIDPVNYTRNSGRRGITIDVDNVLRHEFGHGLGLSHDPTKGSTMSTPYNLISEHLSERDIFRIQQKYGYKKQNPFLLKMKLRWLWYFSDKY